MPPVDGWSSKFKDYRSSRLPWDRGRLFLCLIIVVSDHISETDRRQHKAHEPDQPFHRQHTPHLLSSFSPRPSCTIPAQSFRKLPDSSEEHRVLRKEDQPPTISVTPPHGFPRSPASFRARRYTFTCFPKNTTIHGFPSHAPFHVPQSPISHQMRRPWLQAFTAFGLPCSPASRQMRPSMAYISRPIQPSTVSRFPPYKLILTHFPDKCNVNIYLIKSRIL